ncbi:MAG: putative flap endonuclease-1-like 5' DNA nuclease [Psychroserpens sp.]|jgi:predicted flap endonuclease-1-like 5' DNA nuclease
MNFEHITLLNWPFLALFGVIFAILGFLWGKSASNATSISSELKLQQDSNAKLKVDLEACNQKLASQKTKSITPESKLNSVPVVAENTFNADLAKQSFGKKIKLNDLKVIEGIGPKIEKLFHDFEIKSWDALSEASVKKCQDVLDSGGDRYRIHNPGSWPMQAKMAHEGRWKALARWQEEHKAGKL